MIAQLDARTQQLAAAHDPSPADMDAIEADLEETRAGLEMATPEGRGQIFERFRVKGTIRDDPAGRRLGRCHRWDVQWSVLGVPVDGEQLFL